MCPIFLPVKNKLVRAFHSWAGLSITTLHVIAKNTRVSYTAGMMNAGETVREEDSTTRYSVGPIADALTCSMPMKEVKVESHSMEKKPMSKFGSVEHAIYMEEEESRVYGWGKSAQQYCTLEGSKTVVKRCNWGTGLSVCYG